MTHALQASSIGFRDFTVNAHTKEMLKASLQPAMPVGLKPAAETVHRIRFDMGFDNATHRQGIVAKLPTKE